MCLKMARFEIFAQSESESMGRVKNQKVETVTAGLPDAVLENAKR